MPDRRENNNLRFCYCEKVASFLKGSYLLGRATARFIKLLSQLSDPLPLKSVYLCQRRPSANSWRASSRRIKRDVSWPNIWQKIIFSLPILHPSSVLQSAGTLRPSWQRCSEYLSEVRNMRVCSFTDQDDNDEMFHVSRSGREVPETGRSRGLRPSRHRALWKDPPSAGGWWPWKRMHKYSDTLLCLNVFFSWCSVQNKNKCDKIWCLASSAYNSSAYNYNYNFENGAVLSIFSAPHHDI